MFCWFPHREKLLNLHVLNEHRPKVCKGRANIRDDDDRERIREVCSVPDYLIKRPATFIIFEAVFFYIDLKANEIILSDYKYINYTNY